ncbi:helix-turn-helix domain-containing protein [Paludisphaera rhizosphaerae]|uniref:hypothetical protein n=1 Tax=Paludisphaera rhizosphaerae TaxID=2711216 RepID=UPI0013EB23CC|nr:hypothetical protein [Paludisphaera rhizosphaerae]
MFVNANGEGVMPLRPVEFKDDEAIERARDLMMLALSRKRIPLRVIARIFGVSKSTAGERIRAIPEKARAHYAARSLV